MMGKVTAGMRKQVENASRRSSLSSDNEYESLDTNRVV